ncbi:MAG: hypothetical protein FWD44_01920 [Oscillospiraceae bacterium]|nr:hypothetical protein [Oscillospiraceae bacterium]
MFLHQLPKENKLFTVKFDEYAKRHYLKRFMKDYKGRQWEVTEDSIFQDLSRIKMNTSDLQFTQQVDELWHKDNYWVFKYDFRIAQTKESTKTSGNRCVVFLDNTASKISILIIFGKNDLPKNVGERAFIEQTLDNEFGELMKLVG